MRAYSRPHFILAVGDDGVLFAPHNVAGAPFFAAHDDEKTAAAILEILARHPRARLTLLADTLAQDVRREALPRLSLFDRPKLVKRRLQQAFPQARLAASLYAKTGRSQVLLAALHDNSPVFAWLERLKNHAPRVGLLPVESADLMTRLMPDAAKGWVLLLSRQRTGGFRQIVTHDGELAFTRLTPGASTDAAPRVLADAVRRDIKATLGYLARLGLNDSSQLRVMLLLSDDVHKALEEPGFPAHSWVLVSPNKVAQHLRLPFIPPAGDPYADLVHAGWLAKKGKLRLPLMLPDMREVRRTEIIRHYGMRAAAAAMLIFFMTTAWQAGDALVTMFKAHLEVARLTQLREQLTQEQAAAPPAAPLGKLRQAFERRRLFAVPTATPWPMLMALNQGLGGEARLVKFDWRAETGKASGAATTETLQADVKLTQVAEVSRADRPHLVAYFQDLTQKIAHAIPGYDVNLTRYPFPALPQDTLSGGADGKGDEMVAELTIRKATP